MIVAAMEDVIEHCLTCDGRFYYKELPSLRRRSAGPLVLEALAHAYDVSADPKFIQAGLATFELALSQGPLRGYSGPKFAAGDAVVWPRGPGPKAFGATIPPLYAFYRAATDAGLLSE